MPRIPQAPSDAQVVGVLLALVLLRYALRAIGDRLS